MSETNRSREISALRRLLHRHFATGVEDITPLTGGMFSRAYGFRAGANAYVVRINTAVHAYESFAKDDYAWQHFASPNLPIPRIVARGELDGEHYAISERVPGRTLDALSSDERRPLHPAVLDTLEVIGHSDISASTGYGDWDRTGNGRFASWHDFLLSITDDHPDGYYANWHQLFDTSFLERDLFEAIAVRMRQLAVRCPNARCLVHYDYQFENILSDGARVTGVIDWANALYGDPLYDVAWLTWLAANPGWWFEDGDAYLHARFGAEPGYTVRITCYQFHIGLDHLRYYATNDNRVGYETCRRWLLDRLAAAP